MFERYIEEQVGRQRGAIALAAGQKSYTYGEMAADIRRCFGWLKTLKLKPGARVALQLSDFYAYWVLFFSLEAHQVITVALPLVPTLTEGKISDLKICYVFSDSSRPKGWSTGWTHISARWFSQFRRFRNLPLPALKRQGEDPICIVLSSGTTGAAKKVMFDRAMLDRRVDFDRKSGVYAEPPGRTLAAISPAAIAGLSLGLGSFAGGAALCVRDINEPWGSNLRRLSVNVLVLAPIHIEEMLANLPPDFKPVRPIAVFVVGGTLSAQTIEDLRRRVSDNIIQGYGTVETGGIAQGHISLMTGAEDSAGFVSDWVQVSLIDEAGQECPPGMPGEVRVRGPTVVQGYLDDDEQNLKSFRSGWYHPGDLATTDINGVIRVVGRIDDIINIGGRKIIPATVETILLRGDDALVDVAVFGAHDSNANLRIWIAFVGPDSLDHGLIRRALRGVPAVSCVRLSAVPRNFLGKIERAKLRGDAEAGLLAGEMLGC